MPSIEEIKLALGTMDKSSNASSINENVNPASFSQELFAPIEKLEAIGGLDAIVPSEGVVFKYKGKTYKFTGAFAPINQILGSLKFG